MVGVRALPRGHPHPVACSRGEVRTPERDLGGIHHMKARSVLFLGLLVLGTGCTSDAERFVGTYHASGTWTIFYGGEQQTVNQDYTVTITEGISSDLIIADEGGCKLPADVKDDVVTIRPEATCQRTVETPYGPVLASYRVTSGTVVHHDSHLQMEISGAANSADPNIRVSGGVSMSMMLTKDGS